MVAGRKEGATAGAVEAAGRRKPAAERRPSAGALLPAPLPHRHTTRFPGAAASDTGSDDRSGRSTQADWSRAVRYAHPGSVVGGGGSRIWDVRRPGDDGGAGDTFEARVRRIAASLRNAVVVSSVHVSPAEISAELTRQGGHAGRTLHSLLPEVEARTGITVEADREDIEGKPVLPEFMVQKIEDMASDTELKARQRAEIEQKWKMIDKRGDKIYQGNFLELLMQLGINKTEADANVAFNEVDVDGNGAIDFDEFANWMGKMVRHDPRVEKALSRIGDRQSWAHVKIPSVRRKESGLYPGSRTLKFLAARAKIRPSGRYWVEILGSRLTIYDSDNKVEELARLQLSDPEVERSSLGARRAEGWGDTAGDGGGDTTQENPAEATATEIGHERILHVGGIQGDIEDEAKLEELFEQFGAVETVILRRRREGKKVSWALVTYHEAESVAQATAVAAELSESSGLIVRAMDQDQASQSTGEMSKILKKKLSSRLHVIELWLRLTPDTELYRVAIDLSSHRTATVPDPKAWVDTISLYIEDRAKKRSGAQLWNSLATRLRLVVQLQKQYGDIHEMYGASSSGFQEIPVPQFIRHPDSWFSMMWDLLQLVMLLMVCYYVPLRTGFDLSVVLWSYEFWQDAFIDVYFILDIIIQFRSAYWDSSGVLVVDTRPIRNKYLSGWFAIDFVCVLPLGYIGYFRFIGDGGEGSASFRAVKSLRLLRMGKMMRLAKVYKMVQKYDSIAELKPLIAIFGLIFLVMLASHLLACFWFLIGVEDQIMERQAGAGVTVLKGWVNQKAEEDDWWGELGRNATLSTRYVTSMYGIFNALENGFTDSEKGFAIFAELIVGSVIYGGLAAVLSAAMMEAQQSSEEFNKNYKAMKSWMTARKVASNYQKQVLACYSHKFKDSTTFNEEQLLAELPPAMASNLMEKLYGKFVADVPYFRGLDQTIIIRLSQEIKTLTAERGSAIMEEGRVGKEMFILVDGEVMVEQQGIELGFFNRPGSFFGENPVIYWDESSERRERTVRAVTDCFLVFLDQEAVMQVAQRYPELEQKISEFQRLGHKHGKRKPVRKPVRRTGAENDHATDGGGNGREGADGARNDENSGREPSTAAVSTELSAHIDRKFAALRTVMVQEMQDEIQVCFSRMESKLLSAMQDSGRKEGNSDPHGRGTATRP